jgi:hypothetical protein
MSPHPVPLPLQMSARAKGWMVGSILALATCVAAVYAYFDSYHLASLGLFVGTFVVAFMSLTYVETLGFSLWWHLAATHSTTSH